MTRAPSGGLSAPVAGPSGMGNGVSGRGLSAPATATATDLTCRQCHKVFSRRDALQRHQKTCSGPTRLPVAEPSTSAAAAELKCPRCQKVFSRPDNLLRHEKTCAGPKPSLDCTKCGKTLSRQDKLRAHEKQCEGLLTCDKCDMQFQDKAQWTAHRKTAHPETRPAEKPDRKRRQPKPADEVQQRRQHLVLPADFHEDPEAPLPDVLEEADREFGDPLVDVYERSWSHIRTHAHLTDRVQSRYNIRMERQDTRHLEPMLWNIFEAQAQRFRINLSYGIVLQNRLTDELRYYHSSQNNARVLDKPPLIVNRDDFAAFLQDVDQQDLLEWAGQQRPNSEWIVVKVTNVTVYVNRILDHPIGCCNVELPDYILNAQGVVALHAGQAVAQRPDGVYQDRLCFFRCLVLHHHPNLAHNRLEEPMAAYYQMWCDDLRDRKQPVPRSPEEFEGMKIDRDLDEAERVFKVNINVYELEQRDGKTMSKVFRRSACLHPTTLNLNVFEQHFSYIKDLERFCHSFQCRSCGQLWKSWWMCDRHENTCVEATTFTFPRKSKFKLPLTVFEKLDRLGIEVPVEERFYPFFATFDFEAYLDTSNLPAPTDKQSIEAHHVPLSVSICSNVPGFKEAQCFVTDGDPAKLVDQMMARLHIISLKAQELLQPLYQDILDELETQSSEETALAQDFWQEMAAMVADNRDDDDDDEEKQGRPDPATLADALQDWMMQMPCLGFNSANYDVNLVKKHLMKWLRDNNQKAEVIEPVDQEEQQQVQEEEQEAQPRVKRVKIHDDDLDMDCEVDLDATYVVKKQNSFVCIATPHLKFLDISNYLAPGFSYDKYLKAYKCQVTKGFFPYEWVTDLDKLDEPQLPPHEAFYSKLNDTNITEEEYAYCQQVWRDHQMTTFRDFLIWYNNRDVQPFVEAVEKQFAFFRERGLDMFKDGISVPGLTMKYLFGNNEAADFHLFGEQHQDLYFLIKDQIVGGPSLIFHRYHEAEKTKIREAELDDPKTCKTVVGYDANALYLWALSQPMPTGNFVRRTADSQFAVEGNKTKRPHSEAAVQWLEYLQSTDPRYKIRHAGNGPEVRIGPKRYPVDGFDPRTKTVMEFHGCFYHAHDCPANARMEEHPYHPGVPLEEIRRKTAQKSAYLRALGYNVIEIWECDWQRRKRIDPDVKRFLAQRFPKSQPHLPKTMTEEEVLQAVECGTLFGLVHCDIRVPNKLKGLFAEMPPIFKNATVSREDIGELMQRYAEENHIMEQPRRMLIGSYYGEKILLATPLLQWYLRHGLEVTKVHQVLEYQPVACFQKFAQDVTAARREGDRDPDAAILAESMKLLGNCGYGKTVTNKMKFRDVCYVGEASASRMVNSKNFRQLNPLDKDLYEVESAKATISLDLPHHVGFFVYQYAKLKMLQFRFDFIEEFLDRPDYQLVEMDTDSLYMALSGPSLEAVVKPEKRQEFYQSYPLWFPALACDQHQPEFVDAKMTDQTWIQAPCCQQRQLLDKRTPGLFKEEWQGQGMVALCSKTYFGFGKTSKVSCKGLQKKRNNFNKEHYLKVLTNQASGRGINRGFRSLHASVVTYTQARTGLTYFYGKRKVLEDGISTAPLDI